MRPPKSAARRLAKEVGFSSATVHRIWQKFGLQPTGPSVSATAIFHASTVSLASAGLLARGRYSTCSPTIPMRPLLSAAHLSAVR
jgi:hypothetical protein